MSSRSYENGKGVDNDLEKNSRIQLVIVVSNQYKAVVNVMSDFLEGSTRGCTF